MAWSSVGGAVIRRSAFATLYIPEDISAAKFRRLGAVQLWRYSYCYSNFQLYILRIWSRSLSGAGFHLFPIPIAPHLGSPPLSRFASFPSKLPLFLTNPEYGIISHAAFLTADDKEYLCRIWGRNNTPIRKIRFKSCNSSFTHHKTRGIIGVSPNQLE